MFLYIVQFKHYSILLAIYRVITMYLIIFQTILYILKNSDLKMKAKINIWKSYTNKVCIIDHFNINDATCH